MVGSSSILLRWTILVSGVATALLHDCDCMQTWAYQGATYEGCSATADWSTPWCYVQGGTNCSQHQNSSVSGETRKWRQCGTCNCMQTWTYQGANYEGCSATADSATPWCYVQGGTNCNQYRNSSLAGNTRKWRECGSCNCQTKWNYLGVAYEGCSATADWATPWCYVQGGTNCNQYKNSFNSSETRKWRECGSCNCQTKWNYLGIAYEGCSATPDSSTPWCYVQGGSNCNQYKNSTVSGETRKWRQCGSCNCQTKWNYLGAAYEGCSATPDSATPWCYVQGGTNCNQYKDSSVAGETRKWRQCSSCNCQTKWNYLGVAYEGCSATPDSSMPWCYVQGGTNCNQYKDSTIAGETRKWRQCSSCNCQTKWNYLGIAYEGCSATPDSATPWCYVQGGTNCNQYKDSTVAGETRKWRQCGSCNCQSKWNYLGVAYEGCSATPDSSTPWCYVQGGTNCNQYKDSTITGETRKWRQCGSCNCQSKWNYLGVAYEGCSATADSATPWCYVQGGSNCIQYKNSTVVGETRKWRQCDSCNCQTTWNYRGVAYEGCSATPDSSSPWCYVQGGSNCNQYRDSTVVGETRKWRSCGTCNCQTGWNYKGAAYKGCSLTPDSPSQHWCYVQGGSNCAASRDSSVAGEVRKWLSCDVCQCMAFWNYKGASYNGCTSTPDSSSTWCYVEGGSSCPQHKDSTVAGETRKWRACDNCACQTQWDYKGARYSGCAVPAGELYAWCYVDGGSSCPIAQDAIVANEQRKWKTCTLPEMTASHASDLPSTAGPLVALILTVVCAVGSRRI